MKRIPWKGIAIGCLILMLLVAARSAVTVGKAFYYGYDWVSKLMADPWFIVGIVAAMVGVASLILMGALQKQDAEEAPILPEESEAPEEVEEPENPEE